MTSTNTLNFRRGTRNLLVTGHRSDRLNITDSARKQILDALENVILECRLYTESRGECLRILTGFADGTDENAASIAEKLNIPLHVIAPFRPNSVSSSFSIAERVSLIVEESDDDPAEAWVAASDEAKLAFADAMIVVWDGQAPQNYAGGSVRLLIEALRRYSPVIWIDAREEYAGTVRVVDPTQLDEPTLAMLDADEKNVSIVQKQFISVGDELASGIRRCLDIFWDYKPVADFEKFLAQNDVDPEQHSTYSGLVHTFFLGLLGEWKRKKLEPIFTWRGPDTFVDSCFLPEMIWAWFDRFDRVAIHASNKLRDNFVIIHLLSSLAVLGAVAGVISWLRLGQIFWGLFEFATLFGIGLLVWRNKRKPAKDHKVWLDFRQAAESLRVSALLYPAMATLPALHRGIWQTKDSQAFLAKPYYWLVVQLLREVGTPTSSGHHCLSVRKSDLFNGLNAIIDSQIDYHNKSHDRHHITHQRLHSLIKAVFFIVVISVLLHVFALGIHQLEHHELRVPELLLKFGNWIHEQRWMLLITAFFPALAAALHGIMGKLEMQRVAENSHRISIRLQAIKIAANGQKEDFMALRALAIETANTMYAEYEAWAELMKNQDLEIPA